MPTLYILAGPNGTGKTTFYNTAVEEGNIDSALPFINVDNIARYELGGYSEENFIKSAEIAKERIGAHISQKEDFMIESNLAKTADYNWIGKMKDSGYEMILYFLSTADVEVNIDRVNKRVKEGGHFIPAHMVIDRYKMGLIYLKSKLYLFKETYLIDNTGETVREIATVIDGKIEVKTDDCPAWVESILYILRRQEAKKK